MYKCNKKSSKNVANNEGSLVQRLAVQAVQACCTKLPAMMYNSHFYATFPFIESGNGAAITKVQTALIISEFDTKAYFLLYWGNQHAIIRNCN